MRGVKYINVRNLSEMEVSRRFGKGRANRIVRNNLGSEYKPIEAHLDLNKTVILSVVIVLLGQQLGQVVVTVYVL